MAHIPKRTSRLIFDERPLLIPPSLAVAIGLNEAVFVQQLHYWLNESSAGRVEHGRRWIYNTYDDWLKQFPFWSLSTLRRIISGLEQSGYLLTTQEFNASAQDRTKWYSLDYDAIDEAASRLSKSAVSLSKMNSLTAQDEQMGLLNLNTSTTKQKTSHKREDQTIEINPRLIEAYVRDYSLEFHDDRPTAEREIAIAELWRQAGCDQAAFAAAVGRARANTQRKSAWIKSTRSDGLKNKMPEFLAELEKTLHQA